MKEIKHDEFSAEDRQHRRGPAQGARLLLDRRLPDEVFGLHARDQSAPLLGEHTDEVLRELGYSNDQIAKLHEKKAVGSTGITPDQPAVARAA